MNAKLSLLNASKLSREIERDASILARENWFSEKRRWPGEKLRIISVYRPKRRYWRISIRHAHKVDCVKSRPFQAYKMFSLSCAYARLQADFQTMSKR